MITIEVLMKAFGDGPAYPIRKVEIPAKKRGKWTVDEVLDVIFHYGQNDFQQQRGMPSVSVGDVIAVGCQNFRVERVGFEEVIEEVIF